MALAGELELPSIDLNDLGLRGERFHTAMRDLRDASWLAAAPLGFVVLDREAATFFLRTRSATFPGMKIAELFGIESGPLREEMERNILHLNGDVHRRLRNLVNPAFTPRAADRWRPAMRGFLEQLFAAVAPAGRCGVGGAVAKPHPSPAIAAPEGAPPSGAPR